jgi:hypothetical protein
MDKPTSRLVAATIILVLSLAVTGLGVYLKVAWASAPGSRTGLGAPGDLLYITSILYESNPAEFLPVASQAPFGRTGIMGPYVGTISGINEIAGITGAIGIGHLYYGYDWCRAYPSSADCSQGRFPLCLVVWTPTVTNSGEADKAYKSCYSANSQTGEKAWRSALESTTAAAHGYSAISTLQALTDSLDLNGMAHIDND